MSSLLSCLSPFCIIFHFSFLFSFLVSAVLAVEVCFSARSWKGLVIRTRKQGVPLVLLSLEWVLFVSNWIVSAWGRTKITAGISYRSGINCLWFRFWFLDSTGFTAGIFLGMAKDTLQALASLGLGVDRNKFTITQWSQTLASRDVKST